VSNPFERLRALARWSGDDDDLASEAAGALAGLAGDPGLVVACRRMLAHHPATGPLWWILAHLLASPDPSDAARQCRDALNADRTADRLAAALPLQDEGEVLAVVGWPRVVDRALAERVDVDAVAIRFEGKLGGVDPTWSLRHRTTERTVRVVGPWECQTLGVTRVLVPAIALDDRASIVAQGVAELCREMGDETAIWIVAGVGRVLPRALLDALVVATNATDPDEAVAIETLAHDAVERIVGPRGAEAALDAVAGHPCPIPAELLKW